MKRIMIVGFLFIAALMFVSCGNTPDSIVDGTTVSLAPNVTNNSEFGRCVAYCSRAIVYMYVDDGDGKGGMTVPEEDPNFDNDDWIPIDVDGDGEIEICTKELIDGLPCFKVPGGCPEPDGTCGALPKDGIGFWCRLMKGKDPHVYPN